MPNTPKSPHYYVMQQLNFYIVDAFTHGPFSGNPAAVVPLDGWLPDAQMQSMAAQHNLTETAFLMPSADQGVDFEIRWFTPTIEVPLCGHVTLASAHVIVTKLGIQTPALSLKTRTRGTLKVRHVEANAYAMTFPAIDQHAVTVDQSLMKALNLTVLEAYSGDFLTLVLPDVDAVASYRPDFPAILKTGRELIITAAGKGPAC